MKALKLYFIALFLITVVNTVNRFLFKRKIKELSKSEKRKKLEEYDRQEAMALDAFAGRNYRTFWNDYLKTENGYKFGELDEMISSAMGKNEVDGTLSRKGSGKLSSWFYGVRLSKWLDKAFNEKNHCVNAIDLTKGNWVDTRNK